MEEAVKAASRCGLLLFGIFCLHLTGFDAMASEGGVGWRPIYDTVLRWFNFIVLVFLIVKFGKDPIKKFFASQTGEIVKAIEQIEMEKQATDEKIAAARMTLKESIRNLDGIKERILQQAEKRKSEILANSQRQSDLMLKDVERKMEKMIDEARASIAAEMVDTAVEMVKERLPKELNKEDNRRIIDQYLKRMASRQTNS